MEPIQHMFRVGVEVLRESAHGIAAVREEGNLLIGLQAL